MPNRNEPQTYGARLHVRGGSQMNLVTKEQARKGGKWWAEAIVHPQFKTLSDQERSDASSIGAAMAEGLAGILADKNPVTREEADRFAEVFEKVLSETGHPYFHQGVSVDYGPDGVLAAIAEEAGIGNKLASFPWKTHMFFHDDGTVKVAHGYGAPFVTL